MAEYERFLVFDHGNIMDKSLRLEYDCGPMKKLKVQVDSSSNQIVQTICEAVGINPSANPIEIVHKYPIYMIHICYTIDII